MTNWALHLNPNYGLVNVRGPWVSINCDDSGCNLYLRKKRFVSLPWQKRAMDKITTSLKHQCCFSSLQLSVIDRKFSTHCFWQQHLSEQTSEPSVYGQNGKDCDTVQAVVATFFSKSFDSIWQENQNASNVPWRLKTVVHLFLLWSSLLTGLTF